jgi:hypothetical protein
VIFFKACCNNPPRNGTATTLRSASCRAQPKTQIQRDPKGSKGHPRILHCQGYSRFPNFQKTKFTAVLTKNTSLPFLALRFWRQDFRPGTALKTFGTPLVSWQHCQHCHTIRPTDDHWSMATECAVSPMLSYLGKQNAAHQTPKVLAHLGPLARPLHCHGSSQVPML